MISMQYNIKLPADYDMDIIKKRVRDNGHKTDGFQDLEMKAYLIAEKGRYGNLYNEYAPFYLWRGIEGLNSFLLGGPFNNILRSFGWASVNTWQVLNAVVKKTDARQFAAIRKDAIAPTDDLTNVPSEQARIFSELNGTEGLTGSVIGYNPTTWELCAFGMFNDGEPAGAFSPGTPVYEVHHISR